MGQRPRVAELETAMKLTDFFDRAYVINLRRRSDRMQQFCEEVDSHFGVPSGFIRRWDAFDNPKHGHSGCTRSHRELLRYICSSGLERVLVFEDDCAAVTKDVLHAAGFRPEGNSVWNTHCRILNGNGTLNERFMGQWVPADWDVLYLGGGYGEPPLERINPWVIRCGFMQTTSSYGITREFAQRWTEEVNKGGGLDHHPGPIDNVFGSMAHSNRYYVLQPRLTYQRESVSDITGQKNSYLMSMTDPAHENMV